MQLDTETGAATIPAGHIDPAKIEKRIQTKKASAEARLAARAVNPANRQSLLRFLRKHTNIDLSRAVFQRGPRNYAGPDCPGPAWNCTSARHVVQITALADDDDDGGSTNRFSCSASYGDVAGLPDAVSDSVGPDFSCVVVQVKTNGSNNAECIQRSNDLAELTQNCEIYQTTGNGSNRARIEQDANHSSSGGVQNVLQTAVVDQDVGVDGSNRADVFQDVDLEMKGTADQMQDAHQRADVDMFVGDDGDNTANVDQSQDLEGEQNAAEVNQLQNTDHNDVADCVSIQEPDAPNSCADVDMFIFDRGNNRLELDQDNDLSMSVGGGGGDGVRDDDDDDDGSSSVDGVQQQGTCEGGVNCGFGDDPDGGTEAGVEMFTENGSSIGEMSGTVRQDVPSNTPDITQLQFADPWCCYGTNFIGDTARAEIDLLADQNGGDNTYQAGENGVGCVVVGGNCIAEMEIQNEDGTFRATGRAPILFANQNCEHEGFFGEGLGLLENGPQCTGSEVIFTTTTTTFTDTGTIG